MINRRHPLLRRLPLALVALAAVIGLLFFRDALAPDAIATHAARLAAIRDQHYALAVLVFMAGYVAIVALSLPGATLATLTGGLMFGLFPGVLYNIGAATLGATLIFLAVRIGLGAEVAARLAQGNGRAAQLMAGLSRNPWWALLALRLAPVVPFFVANLLPAFAGIRLWPFVVTTALGIVPGAVILTALGQGLGGVLAAGGKPDLAVLGSASVVVPLTLLAALSLVPMLFRRGKEG
ncbi:TVP38/TMEM64 family protein [Fuscibacter oryzae]|uniref:TVP38/TMEM64 family membrane protein n=1 Tax=Fuscibacter oryzae TaxID=2803939 RepID=A0A8J7SSL3_9RHOB|nr:VTT domain-containing protein [Fuscibacter oryzae]MBL4928461.1 TVP38/TMEM64 family protein [Fuscibacter oryzae]